MQFFVDCKICWQHASKHQLQAFALEKANQLNRNQQAIVALSVRQKRRGELRVVLKGWFGRLIVFDRGLANLCLLQKACYLLGHMRCRLELRLGLDCFRQGALRGLSKL